MLIVNTLGIPWLNTFTTVVCGFLLVELLFKAPFFSSLIATIAVVLISVMCEFFPLMILAMIVDENVSVVLSSPLNSAGFSLISTCCFFCVLRCSRYLLRKKYKSSCIAIDNNGWAILFPFISIIFVYYTIYTDSLVEATRLHTAVHSFLYCAIIISNIGFFFGETTANRRYKMRQQLAELEFQQSKAEAILKLKDEHIEEMNELLHDFNSQLSGLKTLLFNRSISEDTASSYIDQMRENVEALNDYIYVDSKPLQLILNQTSRTCSKYKIDFSLDVRYDSFEFMSFPDIFSLFENSLDNAVNACRNASDIEAPRIELSVCRINETILIQISNSYSVEHKKAPIYTSDRATKSHGFGTQNIRKIVKKYSGSVQVSISDEYKLMITLPLQHDNVSTIPTQ